MKMLENFISWEQTVERVLLCSETTCKFFLLKAPHVFFFTGTHLGTACCILQHLLNEEITLAFDEDTDVYLTLDDLHNLWFDKGQ